MADSKTGVLQAPPTARPSSLPPEAFSRQLEGALIQAAHQLPRALVVRLEPQSLGEMTLQVALEGERIAARISVESEAVAALIQDAKPELDQQMRGRGFVLEQLEVRQDCGQQGQAQQHPTGQQADRPAQAEKGPGLRRQEPTAAAPQSGSSLPWGVDLLA
jgi:flagellar hook-length control protein FliK